MVLRLAVEVGCKHSSEVELASQNALEQVGAKAVVASLVDQEGQVEPAGMKAVLASFAVSLEVPLRQEAAGPFLVVKVQAQVAVARLVVPDSAVQPVDDAP